MRPNASWAKSRAQQLSSYDAISPKYPILSYPAFDEDPHPALVETFIADCRELRTHHRSYAASENPPILHRKECFVSEGYPLRETFARLTKAEVEAGLLSDSSEIGNRTCLADTAGCRWLLDPGPRPREVGSVASNCLLNGRTGLFGELNATGCTERGKEQRLRSDLTRLVVIRLALRQAMAFEALLERVRSRDPELSGPELHGPQPKRRNRRAPDRRVPSGSDGASLCASAAASDRTGRQSRPAYRRTREESRESRPRWTGL